LAPKIQSQKVSRKKASKRLSHEKDTLKTLVKLPLLVVHFLLKTAHEMLVNLTPVFTHEAFFKDFLWFL